MDASSWPSIARCNVSWSTRSMSRGREGDMYGAFFCARTRSSGLLPALGVFASVLSWIVSCPASAADPKVRIFSVKDEGLDAEITVFTTGATATEAFRAGRGDFISAGDLPSAAMWKTGNVIGLAPLSSDTEIFGIVGKKEINAPGDLRGRKVATRIGSTGEFLLYRYLASGGLSPSDVTIVDLAPPDMVVALVHGDIDAFAWLAPFTTRAVSTGTNIKLITSAKGLANNRIVLSVTKSFANQTPELVRKVLRATKRATDFVRFNPEEATEIWAEAVQGKVAQSLPVVRLITYDMTFNDAFVNDMNELAKFMVQKGALKEPINWAMEMNPSFLREVDPKLVAASGR
ncbi:MAG: ABC transporter substrate-binding protein [Alphaproteobacteria bacterium]|nr:MAG: ABC transporter substrate-binding protein [Alphaproteobacteria bacterium]